MKIFTKILILIIFVLTSNTSFAQSINSQTFNFKDNSPGVVGELSVYTETTSEDKGIVSITGNLRYEFPPQPATFSITIKNVDGKGTFKDFTKTTVSQNPSRINIVFNDVPLDKSSATRDLATRDRFQITSSVDKGVDFFFQAPTYVTFKKFTPNQNTGQTTGTNNQNTTQADLLQPIGISSISSLSVLSSTPLPKIGNTERTQVTFLLISNLAENQELPVFGGLARLDGDNFEYNTDTWAKTQNQGTAQNNLRLGQGITKHTFILEKGKSYTFFGWLSADPSTRPIYTDSGPTFSNRIASTVFSVSSDYFFGKPVSNEAPALQKARNKKIDSTWNALTSDYRPGSIDFFNIGSGDVSRRASDNAYVFLTNVPGLANSTSSPVKGATDCGPSNPDCKSFDPTIPGAFNGFIATIINMVYGFVIIGAVINLIISGIKLMGSVTPFKKAEVKDRIVKSFIAIALVLGTYLILNTINPNLTSFSVGNVLTGSSANKFKGQEFNLVVDSVLSGEARVEKLSSRKLTGTFKRTEFYGKIKTFSALPEYNIPHCLIQVTILAESGGVRGLIGHDENVASQSVPARIDFIKSGKKKSGATFNPDNSLITTRNHLNDDYNPQKGIYSAPNESADDLGLDWRFSHGMGMFGVTFFPKGAKYGDYSKGIYMPILKQTVTPKMIHTNPDIDLKVAIEMMKANYEKCGKDVAKTFNAYVGGGCEPKPGSKNYGFVVNESSQRKKLYDQCIAQDR